jgi:hypothetical protein
VARLVKLEPEDAGHPQDNGGRKLKKIQNHQVQQFNNQSQTDQTNANCKSFAMSGDENPRNKVAGAEITSSATSGGRA